MSSRRKVALLFLCFLLVCSFAGIASRKIIMDVFYKKIQSSQVELIFHNLTEKVNLTEIVNSTEIISPTENATNNHQIQFRPSSVNTCPKNMRVFKLLPTNETICECMPRFLYYAKSDSCYEAYRQGPCNSTSEYLILSEKNKTVRCMDNPCKVDGQVLYEGNCYPLQSIDGPCGPDKYLNINEDTFKVECMDSDIVPFIIVKFPKLDCPAGTRRNSLNICKEEIKDDS